jgi:hypothetical protein
MYTVHCENDDRIVTIKLPLRGLDTLDGHTPRDLEHCSLEIYIAIEEYTDERSKALDACLANEANHPFLTSDALLQIPEALFDLLPKNEPDCDRCWMRVNYQYTKSNHGPAIVPWIRFKRKLSKLRKHLSNAFRFSGG